MKRRNHPAFRMNPIACAVSIAIATAVPQAAYAQAPPNDDTRRHELEEIIVTGTTTQGRTKLESSVAITTVDAAQIAREAPLGTADVLELVPGFWVEDSGGEVSNNVAPRGLGGGSAFKFISIQEDGLPVVYDGSQVDSQLRQDIMIERFEAIRGGTAGILSVNGPASIVNFITRKGSSEAEGIFRFTTSDYNTYRYDVFYGAPLSDQWVIGAGGYFRSSDGVRDTGFTADHGGQFRINLTRQLEDGELTFSAKVIDDSNSFYLPIALTNPDNPRSIPGLDENDGTLLGPDVMQIRQLTPDGIVSHDLRDGFHTQSTAFGIDLKKQLSDAWSMNVAARYQKLDLDINAVFNVQNDRLRRASERLADADVQAMLAQFGAVQAQYRFAATGEVVTDIDNLNGNGLITDAIALFRQREQRHFVSKAQFNHSSERNELAIGALFVDYQVPGDWVRGSTYMTELRSQPRRLDIVGVDAVGDVVGQLTDNGVREYGSWYGNGAANLASISLYVNDEFQVTDDLRIDGGVRFENARFDASSELQTPFQSLGNDDDNIVANDFSRNFGNGNFLNRSETYNEASWTIGGNYKLNDRFSVYARYADSYQTPIVENAGVLNDGIQGLTFTEIGGRYIGESLVVALTAFETKFENLRFGARDQNTGIEQSILIDTIATGLEFEFEWNPTEYLSIGALGVLQDTKLDGIPAGDVNSRFNGNEVQRTPETQYRIEPMLHIGPTVDLFASFHFLGERFADIGNSIPLPEYETVAIGIIYRPLDALSVQIKGNNLTNSTGLTEGNPRGGFFEATGENIYYARPILGRNFLASVTYNF